MASYRLTNYAVEDRNQIWEDSFNQWYEEQLSIDLDFNAWFPSIHRYNGLHYRKDLYRGYLRFQIDEILSHIPVVSLPGSCFRGGWS